MKDHNTTLGRIKAKKYQKLSERLQSNLESGNWNLLSSRKKNNLLLRKARYEKHLQMLGLAVAITGGSGYVNEVQAQCGTLTAETQVNIFATDDQRNPDVAMDANGNYVVVWDSDTGEYTYSGCAGYYGYYGSSIFARIFDSNGVPTSSEILIAAPTTSSYHDDPSISMDANGNFVVVWETQDLNTCSMYNSYNTIDLVYGKIFNSSGVATSGDILISENTSVDNDDPDVALDANGNFIVVWERETYNNGCTYGSYTPDAIYARTFNAVGTPDGPSYPISDQPSVDSDDPVVAVDANGNWAAAWETSVCNTGNCDIFSKVFDSSHNPTSSEILVNTTTSNDHEDTDVAMDAAGNFVVLWEADNDQDGEDYGVFLRKFNLAGTALSGEIQVNDYTSYDQDDARIAMDSDGNFIVVWESYDQDGDDNGVYYKQFNSSCVALTGELPVNEETNNSQDDATVGLNDAGNIAFAWESQQQDGDSDGVFTRSTFCPPVPIPTIGQWGIFILGLLTAIIGIVGIKQKEKNKRKIFFR